MRAEEEKEKRRAEEEDWGSKHHRYTAGPNGDSTEELRASIGGGRGGGGGQSSVSVVDENLRPLERSSIKRGVTRGEIGEEAREVRRGEGEKGAQMRREGGMRARARGPWEEGDACPGPGGDTRSARTGSSDKRKKAKRRTSVEDEDEDEEDEEVVVVVEEEEECEGRGRGGLTIRVGSRAGSYLTEEMRE
eukprot:8813-Hanusia_phi.AAC.2